MPLFDHQGPADALRCPWAAIAIEHPYLPDFHYDKYAGLLKMVLISQAHKQALTLRRQYVLLPFILSIPWRITLISNKEIQSRFLPSWVPLPNPMKKA